MCIFFPLSFFQKKRFDCFGFGGVIFHEGLVAASPAIIFFSRHMSCFGATKSTICGATGGSCSAILSHLVSGNSPLLKRYFPSGLPQAAFVFLNVCRQGLICHVNSSCLHGLFVCDGEELPGSPTS